MNQNVLHMRVELCEVLRSCGFVPHFVATDGDNRMDAEHVRCFEGYAGIDGGLEGTVRHLAGRGDLVEWPISDLLHLMKNARARLALGVLAFDGGTSHVIGGDSITRRLTARRTTREFQARRSLDLLKDDLAIHAFTLENLFALWEAGESSGAYFVLPFVALSLATRNELLPVATRLALLEIAFQVFFSYVRAFPVTLSRSITERTVPGCAWKTFWTRVMCKRACNLCVGLAWSVTE
jgi:hypothetical protein